jgi:CTP:molybdopterin cytidylyltransferase MocA
MRAFAIVPAAGTSSRMGQPKLLLPLNGQPLVLHTLAAWRRSKVDCVVIVVRPGDDGLANLVRSTGAEVVVPPTPPPDMKASIQAALRHIEQQHKPIDGDCFLVAPADMPRLSPAIIDRLMQEHSCHSARILAPIRQSVRGHPVLFPWPFSVEVFALGQDEGLDRLVHCQENRLVPCDDLMEDAESAFSDIDTPEQYDRLRSEYE